MEKEKPIERKAVKSSNVKSVGFCPDGKCIDIEYGTGVYRYEDCTQDEFDALMKAGATDGQSVGSLIHKTIKLKKFKKL